MNFESQICTTHEQSERLLSLRLKLETADMVYHYTKSKVPALEWELKTTPPTLRGKFWTPQRIAKLSLPFHNEVPDPKPGFEAHHPELIKHAFEYNLSIRRYTADCLVGTHIEDTPIECCVSMIEWLIKNHHFNKEYLK